MSAPSPYIPPFVNPYDPIQQGYYPGNIQYVPVAMVSWHPQFPPIPLPFYAAPAPQPSPQPDSARTKFLEMTLKADALRAKIAQQQKAIDSNTKNLEAASKAARIAQFRFERYYAESGKLKDDLKKMNFELDQLEEKLRPKRTRAETPAAEESNKSSSKKQRIAPPQPPITAPDSANQSLIEFLDKLPD